jgi:uncharacterized protein (TIGR00288 family)
MRIHQYAAISGEVMPANQESVSMALFCDFENVALGVRDAKYEKFDIRPVLERLLLKGSIVVKKAYCDWDRYKGWKASMHEASFELIEIPHVRQSGKNSADIRLVVDALDLCYTKSHVDTFVIISGDSDFSPLVSKLRENAKKVIGVGVKHSTSDLLVANCDEFIFYDDLVREQQRAIAKREAREASAPAKRAPSEDKQPKQENDGRKSQAIAIAVETYEALASERGESGKIWASVLKSAIKRRKPGFSEAQYGFRAFGNLLDEAQSRGLLEVGRDEKNGSFVFRTASATVMATAAAAPEPRPAEAAPAQEFAAKPNRRKERRPRKSEPQADAAIALPVPTVPEETAIAFDEPARETAVEPAIASEEAPRRKRKGAAKKAPAEAEQIAPVSLASTEVTSEPADEPKEPAVKKPSRKSPSRAGRSRKSAEKESSQ